MNSSNNNFHWFNSTLSVINEALSTYVHFFIFIEHILINEWLMKTNKSFRMVQIRID